MKCPSCGAEVTKGRFCAFCGSELPEESDIINKLFGGYFIDGHSIYDREYLVECINGGIEKICLLTRSVSGFLVLDDDLDELTREDICFYVIYLLVDEGYADAENLELIEAAAAYRIDRANWVQCIRKGRVDSDEHYLSRPPKTFEYMVEADNKAFDTGYDLECASMTLELYRILGKIFSNINYKQDVKRMGRSSRFVHMVEKYILNNVKKPGYRVKRKDGEEFASFKKIE